MKYLLLQNQRHIKQLCISADHHGTVSIQLLTVLIVGPPGVGKSSLSHCLLGKPLPVRRYSSQGATYSPKLTVLGDMFTWTELTFSEEIQEIADAIAPVVHEQANSTPIRRGNVLRNFFSSHHYQNTSSSSRIRQQNIRERSDSLDDAVVNNVVTNRSHADSGIKSFVTIIDSGDQKAFLNLYPIFIRNPSLLMIVFKMTDDDDCIWKPLPHDEYHCPEGIFTNAHLTNQCMADLIKHTMANISTYSSAIYGSKTTHVLCVGTHKDKVSPASIAAIDQQLSDLVCESGYNSIVVPKGGKTKVLFPVNNLVAGFPNLEDEVIQQIRKAPLNAADQNAECPVHEVPIKWMQLEIWIRELCNLNDIKFMAYKEVLDVAINSYHF